MTVTVTETVTVTPPTDPDDQFREQTPTFNMQQNEAKDSLSVTSKTQYASWQRLELRASSALTGRLDSATGTDVNSFSAPATAWTKITSTTTPMEAGDELCFASDPPRSSVKVELRDSVTLDTHGNGWMFDSIGNSLQC